MTHAGEERVKVAITVGFSFSPAFVCAWAASTEQKDLLSRLLSVFFLWNVEHPCVCSTLTVFALGATRSPIVVLS